MRGSSEAVQPQTLTRLHATKAVGTIADDSGTEQGRGFFIREICRQRMRKVLPDYTGFSIASIDVVAREPGLLAEIFGLMTAEVTNTIARIKPGNTDTIAFL